MAEGDGRNDYGVSPERFVEIWQSARSAKEAAEAMGIPVETCYTRASQYRNKGIRLKHHKRVADKVQVDKLNKIIEEINERNGMTVEEEVRKAKYQMSDEARGVMLDELLAKLRKTKKYVR